MITFFTRTLLFLLAFTLASTSYADFVGAKGRVLAINGHTYESFTVSETTRFALYFAADYNASLVIMDAGQLSRFTSGQSVSFYDGFDNGNFGLKTVTLAKGSYVIGVRNRVSGQNTVSFELEIDPVSVSGATYNDTYFTAAERIPSGGRLWQPFTIQAGFTYILEGCNTGLEYYLIPASELNNFRSGNTFQYYPTYSGTGSDTNMPGLFTIDNLPTGDYYLAFYNSGQQERALVYSMDRYRDGTGSGGGNTGGDGGSGTSGALELECNCGYSINGDQVTLDASRVVNGRSTTTGTLKLQLWATTSRYAGGSLSGYILGQYTFSSTLAANQYFYNISRTVSYKEPPAGTYYITLTLTETSSGTDTLRDYITFDGAKAFGGVTTAPWELQGVTHPAPTASTARFRIGLTLDNGVSYVSAISSTRAGRMIGTIVPEPQHIGKQADIFVVDRINTTRFMMQNESGTFVDWNNRVPDLMPYKRNVTLTATTILDIYLGSFALKGDHRFFLGYKVGNEALRYIPSGMRFDVTD